MSADDQLETRVFTSAGFGQNAFLVRHPESRSVVAIDPGGEASTMADAAEADGLEVEAVLLTHAHVDHVEGVAEIVNRTGAPVYLHPDGSTLYAAAADQAALYGMQIEAPPPADEDLKAGETLELAGCRFQVRSAPGHAPGHVIFYVEEARTAFVGDVVFQGSIGRSDLPGGSLETLMRSIREQVLTLPDDTVLYSGHGPATTVARERATNPFLVPHLRGGFA